MAKDEMRPVLRVNGRRIMIATTTGPQEAAFCIDQMTST